MDLNILLNNYIFIIIKYKLKCKKCSLLFDSWFASSEEYEKLKKKKYLNCHKCGSIKIEKTLMAPKLINKSWKKNIFTKDNKYSKIDEKIKEYQKFIKKTLSMWVKILLMKRDLFIIKIKKRIKEFTEPHQSRKLKI